MPDTSEDVKKQPYKETYFGRSIEDWPESPNPTQKFAQYLFALFDKPITFIRESIVEKIRPEPPKYYHQKFRRVPTVDECYADDMACVYEANEQYKRDKLVDEQILVILKKRYEECVFYHGQDFNHRCDELKKDWDEANLNLFIKAGDISYGNVVDVYMKQKHRLIMDRRKEQQQQLNSSN